MTGKIVQLSEEVINQIAAGEVIENPASVVKELVDNAIDAEAKVISVEIHGGGHQKILVEDDGCGMSPGDVRLCLLRHATSKLKSAADLEELKTMGFRGEALAAIASVAKVEIRTSDGKEATRLVAEGGRVCLVEAAARNRGTTLEVLSLFYNSPARRKFQKSATASVQQIVRILETLSLSHPSIAFSLRSQGNLLFEASASCWKARIEEVLGKSFVEEGAWVEEEKIRGVFCSAGEARKTRGGQYFFLNRRPIFSPLLSKAVLEGYGTRIAQGTYPCFALLLELDPSEFDVNVHPQKREVRFRDESALFRTIKQTVERAWMERSPCLAAVSFCRPDPFSYRESEQVVARAPPLAEPLPWMVGPSSKPLSLIGSFLLAERGHELYLVDLREESVERALLQSRQQLLFPLEIELKREEWELQAELLGRCEEVGIEARAVGGRIWIEALPEWLDAKDAPAFFETLKDLPDAKEAIRKFVRAYPVRWTLEEAALAWQRSKAPKEKKLDAAELERIFRRQA